MSLEHNHTPGQAYANCIRCVADERDDLERKLAMLMKAVRESDIGSDHVGICKHRPCTCGHDTLMHALGAIEFPL